MSDAEQPKKPIPPPVMRIRDVRQIEVAEWTIQIMGAEMAKRKDRRAFVLAGEAIAVALTFGVSEDEMRELLQQVIDKRDKTVPVEQAIGSLGNCVLAVAAACGLSADACELEFLKRMQMIPMAELRAAYHDEGKGPE